MSQLFDPGPAIVRGREAMALDLIWTTTPAHVSSFVAHDAGWLIGIRSSAWAKVAESRSAWDWKIKEIAFVDNEWHDYDHFVHVTAVRDIRPKYATVYDILAEDEVERALDQAAELEQYAENVILIPKVDVVDRIPERYVIGYSVPSSYGATPFADQAQGSVQIPSSFRGRRLHLLGGSWQAQRAILLGSKFADDVVSADLNHPWKASRYGTVIMPDGRQKDLNDLGMHPRNASLASLTLSLGNIAAAASEISHLREFVGEGSSSQRSAEASGGSPPVPGSPSPTFEDPAYD